LRRVRRLWVCSMAAVETKPPRGHPKRLVGGNSLVATEHRALAVDAVTPIRSGLISCTPIRIAASRRVRPVDSERSRYKAPAQALGFPLTGRRRTGTKPLYGHTGRWGRLLLVGRSDPHCSLWQKSPRLIGTKPLHGHLSVTLCKPQDAGTKALHSRHRLVAIAPPLSQE
jgi:hypothetical protein